MRSTTTQTKFHLYAGAIAGPFFILVYLIEGILRPNYNPLKYPVSSLSIGPAGWIQITNFLITGSLFIVFAFGLKKVLRDTSIKNWAPILMGLIGVGLLGGGVFSTDAIYGYPEDQPLLLNQHTVHGHLHNIFSLLVFIGIPVSCSVFRRHFRKIGKHVMANLTLLAGIMMPCFFVLAGVGFNQVAGFVEIAGVFQRVSTAIGFTWITLLSFYYVRTLNESSHT